MKFEQQTGKTISQAFTAFHKANPTIYVYFKQFAFQWLRTNEEMAAKSRTRKIKHITKISSKQIIGRIRWHVEVDSRQERPAGEFKINDAFTSRYARLFIKDFPQYKDCFELRELRSGEEPQPGDQLTLYNRAA